MTVTQQDLALPHPLPLTEETDPSCLSPAKAARMLADAPWRRFAVIGDSLSAGTGEPTPGYTTMGWPDRVADVLRRVRPELAYLNTARVGATTDRVLATQAEHLAAFRPDLVHVPSGANDLFRIVPDFAEIERSLGLLYAAAAATGARLTAFTFGRAFVVPRFPDWTDRVRTMNGIVRELAADHNAVLVEMWDHPVNDRPGLVGSDGIHFRTSGQAVLAAEVVKALARAAAAER
ncbi:SGNH/GDSL hydrolase family protein [Yinghuangia sp. YIM S09857]|uniref:SGNH/GDSL hydrolase family protein n=1 Tax=Yinghuangia sp. YIM S09857 TaxID=3436929 RepID=UPI003F5319E5